MRAVLCTPTLLVSLVGCGSGARTYPAGGRVTFPDGSPLDGGAVEFRSLDTDPSVSARGMINADGTFSLTTYESDDGAVEGKHQALIVPKRPDGHRWEELRFSGQPPPFDPRFQRFDTSGLTFTVTRQHSENDFHITVERPK